MSPASRRSRIRVGVSLFALLILAGACATPIGVTRADTQAAYRELTRSALSTGKPSAGSEIVLRRNGLAVRYEDDPAGTLKTLRGSGTDLSQDRLFALAELSFLYAEQSALPEYYLATAVYAYTFMMQRKSGLGAGLDPRMRLAADLYNLGLSNGLSPAQPTPSGDLAEAARQAAAPGDRAREVILGDRTLPLPWGELELRGNPDDLLWSGYRMTRFVSMGELKVRGMRNRYRQAGIGAPLAAFIEPDGAGTAADAARKRIPPRARVAVTVLMRLDDPVNGFADEHVRGRLEIYPADKATTVDVDGHPVPLELDPTATLAYGLEGAPVWATELGSFLTADFRLTKESLFMMRPYRPGRVPVVLIHGTASSPARWGEMYNELSNDPILRDKVQFWIFTYSTSNPILQSAAELRQTLSDVVKEIDPDGKDPALRRMVLIGHSQGGLLARLMVTESGSRFWDNASNVPFSEIDAPPKTKAFLERAIFFEPVPSVTRVVFISTPHRGSFRVSTLVLSLIRRVVSLPVTLVKDVDEVVRLNVGKLKNATGTSGGLPTAVDNMNPQGTFVQTLAMCPMAPGVTKHSIISVAGDGPVSGKTDGVVAYESAQLDGVASEKIVRSSHSTQGEPDTILEVRRILIEHVGGH
jgi:pimeloyl-ACP methyl ester carboxylesterase